MPDSPDKVVAAFARRLREQRGLSQGRVAELATQAGFDLGEMAVWSLENGRRRMRVVDLWALGAALDVAPEDLLRRNSSAAATKPAVKYLVSVGDFAQEVVADEAFVDDYQWINFYLSGQRVFFAPSANVQYCQRVGGEHDGDK